MLTKKMPDAFLGCSGKSDTKKILITSDFRGARKSLISDIAKQCQHPSDAVHFPDITIKVKTRQSEQKIERAGNKYLYQRTLKIEHSCAFDR